MSYSQYKACYFSEFFFLLDFATFVNTEVY